MLAIFTGGGHRHLFTLGHPRRADARVQIDIRFIHIKDFLGKRPDLHRYQSTLPRDQFDGQLVPLVDHCELVPRRIMKRAQ